MLIPKFAFKNFSFEYLLLLFTKSKQMHEIKNEPRDLLTNLNKGNQARCYRISHLKFLI